MTVVSADTRPLTWRLQHGDANLDLKGYEALEGYASVRKALKPGGEIVLIPASLAATDRAMHVLERLRIEVMP